MTIRKIILAAFLVLVVTSCNNQSKKEQITAGENSIITSDYSLIGKKGIIIFPEMKAEVNYTSDSILHWKTTNDKGVVAEGTEKMSYKKVNDNLHFLNWIEKDGFTVSQIIDTKKGTVNAFWSYADDKSPKGKRSAMFVVGKFELVK